MSFDGGRVIFEEISALTLSLPVFSGDRLKSFFSLPARNSIVFVNHHQFLAIASTVHACTASILVTEDRESDGKSAMVDCLFVSVFVSAEAPWGESAMVDFCL